VVGDIEVKHLASSVRKQDKNVQDFKVDGGTTKKSMATKSVIWFARNDFQVGEGDFGCFTRYFSTVDFAT